MTSSLLTIFLLPSLLMVGLSFPSMAIGLIIASGLILCSVVIRQESIGINKTYLFVAAIGGLWFFANPYAITNGAQEKQLFSVLAVLLCGAAITSSINLQGREFNNSIKILFWTLIIVGVVGSSGLFKPANYQLLSKPTTPFSEPSHFALVLVPIACAYVFICSNKLRLFTCLASFLLSIWMQNFTLLIGAFLISFVALSGRQMIVFLVSIFVVGVAIFTVDPGYLDYYIDRVVKSEGDNISRLVYIQGWESMISALQFSNGLGVGFQNFGIEPASQATELLDTLIGTPLNRSDGGFLAAKVIGEFGVIGILIALFIVILSIRSGIELRRCINRSEISRNPTAISLCFTYPIILELLFRGVGYFSPSFMIFLFFVPKTMKILGKIRNKTVQSNLFQCDFKA